MTTRCDGVRKGASLRCNATLYRCTACGSTGCTQNKPALCSNQAFDVSEKCLQCGARGQRELIAPERVGLFSTLMHDANA
jgi:hypothetical protein